MNHIFTSTKFMQGERVYITWNICTISTRKSIEKTVIYAIKCSYNKLKKNSSVLALY